MADYQTFVRDQQVQGMINSGRYDARPNPDQSHPQSKHYLNWCNTFADDVAKSHSIKLPRLKDSPDASYARSEYRKHAIPGNENNPALAGDLADFFRAAAAMGDVGVTRVNRLEGKALADKGEYVAAIGGGHATVMAPNIGSQWPVVYRSDQAHRKGKERKLKVGPGELGLYHVKKGFDYSKVKAKFKGSWRFSSGLGSSISPGQEEALRAGYAQMDAEVNEGWEQPLANRSAQMYNMESGRIFDENAQRVQSMVDAALRDRDDFPF